LTKTFFNKLEKLAKFLLLLLLLKQRSALGGLTLNTTSGKITSTITSSYPAEIEYCSASSSSSSSLSSTTTSESTICHELFGSSSSSSSISLKNLRNTGKMMKNLKIAPYPP